VLGGRRRSTSSRSKPCAGTTPGLLVIKNHGLAQSSISPFSCRLILDRLLRYKVGSGRNQEVPDVPQKFEVCATLIHDRFLFAHLSDLHVALRTPAPMRALFNKRLLGFLSWRMHRRRRYRPEILDVLRTDLDRVRPDHVVITGDLTTLALPAEFEEAARQLYAFGGPERVSLVPGNHDAYVPLRWASSWAAWADYMSSEAAASPPRVPTDFTDFPWVRRRSFVAFIGLSSAVPTRPFLAQGWLGAAQLGRLEHLLTRLAQEGFFRVVLVHHSPIDGTTDRRKRLMDAAELRSVICRAGAELILHGHDHRAGVAMIPGPTGPGRGGLGCDSSVPVLSVASATAAPRPGEPDRGAQYYLIEIANGERDWQISLTSHRYDAGAQAFLRGPVQRFEIGRAAGQWPGGVNRAPALDLSSGALPHSRSCQESAAPVFMENG
jgi:3',5'-cyclic AMP phosphodiesterase CpdA